MNFLDERAKRRKTTRNDEITDPLYPDICVPLTGEDGNAFSIIARASAKARKAGVPNNEIELFTEEAMNGDYNHLLRTVMKWFDWE